MNRERVIQLTALQSCTLHGWYSPKRTMSWQDICLSSSITPKTLHNCGVSQTWLKLLQPDIHAWISEKNVSFSDVPYMTSWPLHPINHLGAFVSDMVYHKYDAFILKNLKIDFEVLLNANMTIEWMKLFKFTVKV